MVITLAFPKSADGFSSVAQRSARDEFSPKSITGSPQTVLLNLGYRIVVVVVMISQWKSKSLLSLLVRSTEQHPPPPSTQP